MRFKGLLQTLASVALTVSFTSNAWSDDSLPFQSPFIKEQTESLNAFSIVAAPFSGSRLNTIQEAFSNIRTLPAIEVLLKDGQQSLSPVQRIKGNGIETTKFQSYYKGIEVLGAMALHHREPNRSDISDYMVRFDLDTDPRISASDAAAIAKSLTNDLELETPPILKILPDENGDGSAKLVYWILLKGKDLEPGYEIVIDAHNGSSIAQVSRRFTIAPVEVYETNADCQKVDPESGAPTQLNQALCSHTVTSGMISANADDSARRAAENSTRTLQYYLTQHGRDSYDGKGSASVSIVHVGRNFDNAFWDSENDIMAYGDGDGAMLGDFTRALDVAGHELTHGITSKTARLYYFGQSGALSESYSDFFGKMISNDGDWSIGRQLYLHPKGQAGFRDLANPSTLMASYRDATGKKVSKPYPAHLKDIFVADQGCEGANDNCFVHINSTIPSHAAYLVVQEIGKEKAEKLYYTVLTQYLNPRANFRTARTATLKVCGALYDTTTCAKVKKAFARVGL